MAYNLEGKVVFTGLITFTATKALAWTAGSPPRASRLAIEASENANAAGRN